MSENYDLRKSVKALGKLSPVLKDAHGNVIDGLHRLELYPDWPCVTVDFVDTPEKLEAARLAVNTNRRLVSGSEIAMRVEILLKSGLTVEQISGLTGLSERTIYRYKPLELKKPEAKAISEGMLEVSEIGRNQLTPVSSSIKTQDSDSTLTQEQTVEGSDGSFEDASLHKTAPKAFEKAEFVECERCHIKTSEPKQWHGHTLCTHHFELAEGNPVAYDGWFKMLERGKATTALEPKIPKPSIESWAHRKEAMSQPVSKMDVEMLKLVQGSSEIRELGYSVEFQKEYYVVVCKSDLTLAKNGVEAMCFWDGSEVHKDPERDEANREKAKAGLARSGVSGEVLAWPYKAYSDGERDRLFVLLLERLREIEKWKEPKP